MIRVHLGLDDLARLRIHNGVGPVLEGIFALDTFHRGGPGFQGWRRQVRTALGPGIRPVEALLRRYSPVPDLLWLARRDPVGQPVRVVDANEGARLGPAVMEFCRVAVSSSWVVASTYLREQRELRGHVVISEGIDGLLQILHPDVSWSAPVLSIRSPLDLDVHLNGRGLSLTPSLFLADGVRLLSTRGDQDDLTLAFSVPRDDQVAAALQQSVRAEEGGLPALVGPTRAAALQIIADPCSTGELSERLGISLAGASQHAKVLRKAGLITTARNRNASLHALTSLGAAMLQGRLTEAAGPRSISSRR